MSCSTTIAQLSAACVVIPKQGRDATDRFRFRPLQVLSEGTPGITWGAFRALAELAPKVDGRPTIVGPYDDIDKTPVPTIRTIGYRRLVSHPPTIHAKIAPLGQLWWADDHPSGHALEWLNFAPQRLWISSGVGEVGGRAECGPRRLRRPIQAQSPDPS